jgi:hypothetical protein
LEGGGGHGAWEAVARAPAEPATVPVPAANDPGAGLVTLDVRSNVPVAVEEDSVPTGAAGVVSSTGLPFG